MGYHVLILAGGSGTRLWPLSRQNLPKHLLPLGPGGKSLLRAAFDRVQTLTDSVHIVTAASQSALCRTALDGAKNLRNDALIAESSPRGTGPALALAVRWILDDDADALISSVHSDHHIEGDDAYRQAMVCGAGWAQATQGLATVGVRPTYASTGFGYVATTGRRDGQWTAPVGVVAEVLDGARQQIALRASGFVEKPDRPTAERFLRDGTHLWNSGLFSFSGAAFWNEVKASDSRLAQQIEEVVRLRRSGDERNAAEVYDTVTNGAVEPLVFEKAKELTVVEAQFGWSDLGSLADLHEAGHDQADARGNVIIGKGMAIDAAQTLIESTSGREVVVAGVDGLAVIDTPDAVLVVPLEKSQEVKKVVEELRRAARQDLL